MKDKQLQGIRGMNDWLPTESALWQSVECVLRELFIQYGYKEIRPPLIEVTELFSRSVGEVTDIVEKEMYTFLDRNQQSLSLRPEATAGIVRAGIEHGLFFNQIQRLWHIGPMFRYEAPQAGRYRQFHQADVEVFGAEGPDIDAEILLMLQRLWHRLGLADRIELSINSMGTKASRAIYRQKLVEYFTLHQDNLDEDSLKRLHKNPLRILDSKNPAMQAMLSQAPRLIDYLDEDSQQHFDGLCRRLDAAGVKYIVNPRIVRGMDYYTKTVFEWITNDLGSQGTVCGGGRYDDMVEELGGKPTCAIGFGLGIERLLLLCKQVELSLISNVPDIYMVLLGEDAEVMGLYLSEKIRNVFPQLKLCLNTGGGGIKSQMRKADKSMAQFAIIIGESEYQAQKVQLKPLREESEQKYLSTEALYVELSKYYTQIKEL